MKVLLDTNVILDVILNREPFVADSGAIWQARDAGRALFRMAQHLLAGEDFVEMLAVMATITLFRVPIFGEGLCRLRQTPVAVLLGQ